jgi:DNA-binding IclR family transcriptional regulator
MAGSERASSSANVREVEPSDGGGTVHRVIQLLSVLSEAREPIGVSEIALRLRLPVSTVHRLLKLLRAEGIVGWHIKERQYGIGAEFYRLSARVLASVPIPEIARPTIEALAEQFDETVLLGLHLPGQGAMMFASRADGSSDLQYRLEMLKPLPLIWGASGKAILAFLDTEEVGRVHSEAISSSEGVSPPDLADLRRVLAEIRAKGYAISANEKLRGAQGIAAPIFGPTKVVGCICLTAPIERMRGQDLNRIALQVSSAAKGLSHVLGHRTKSQASTPNE